MNLKQFFHIKFLLENRKKSEKEKAKSFDKDNCIEVKLEDNSNEKSDEET